MMSSGARRSFRPTGPVVTAQPIDLEAAVQTALSQRTDLSVTKKNLEATDISLRAQKNQTLPDLQAIGTYNLAGQGGTQLERDRLTGDVVNSFPGGYFDALRAIANWDAPHVDAAAAVRLSDRHQRAMKRTWRVSGCSSTSD